MTGGPPAPADPTQSASPRCGWNEQEDRPAGRGGRSDRPPRRVSEELQSVPVADWDALLAELGGLDPYTSAAYHAASAVLEPAGTVPVLLRSRSAKGDMALPLLLRPLPDGTGWDATTCYGYGGPVARGEVDPEAFGAALDRWARDHAVVASFLRLHPVRGNAPLVPPSAAVLRVGRTVAWNVSPGLDLAGRMHPHHRRAARKADRAGLQVVLTPQPSSLAAFRTLYARTMQRRAASSFFYFPTSYWSALTAHSAALGTVLVEGYLDGRLVAALLCFADRGWLHYHLGASEDAGRAIGASHRCFLAAATWAQERGLTGFHLGGGVGGSTESPLFAFKQRFDPATLPLAFHVAKFVHDRDRYRQLARTESTAGFFPPWRKEG